jgi:hypothetical protein
MQACQCKQSANACSRPEGGAHGSEPEQSEESRDTSDMLAGLDLEERAELLLLTLEGLHRMSQHSMLSEEDLRVPILQAMDLQRGGEGPSAAGKGLFLSH